MGLIPGWAWGALFFTATVGLLLIVVTVLPDEPKKRQTKRRRFAHPTTEAARGAVRDVGNALLTGSVVGLVLTVVSASIESDRDEKAREADKRTAVVERGRGIMTEISQGQRDFRGRYFQENWGTAGIAFNFTDADLTGAHFKGASVADSIFVRARLDGADFTFSNLARADFREATGLTQKMFESACHYTADDAEDWGFEVETKWPEGFTPPPIPDSCRAK